MPRNGLDDNIQSIMRIPFQIYFIWNFFYSNFQRMKIINLKCNAIWLCWYIFCFHLFFYNQFFPFSHEYHHHFIFSYMFFSHAHKFTKSLCFFFGVCGYWNLPFLRKHYSFVRWKHYPPSSSNIIYSHCNSNKNISTMFNLMLFSLVKL